MRLLQCKKVLFVLLSDQLAVEGGLASAVTLTLTAPKAASYPVQFFGLEQYSLHRLLGMVRKKERQFIDVSGILQL
jgi:hypothetical protein